MRPRIERLVGSKLIMPREPPSKWNKIRSSMKEHSVYASIFNVTTVLYECILPCILQCCSKHGILCFYSAESIGYSINYKELNPMYICLYMRTCFSYTMVKGSEW